MIGIVIVTYASSDVIVDCLASLLATGEAVPGGGLRIVVADNRSPDDTVAQIRGWAAEAGIDLAEREAGDAAEAPPAPVTLLHTGGNLGYAGGVNAGLRLLRAQEDVDLFWILNPDCIVPPKTPAAIRSAAAANPDFGLMGGRIVYQEPPHLIQSDGGRVRRWTGICDNINLGRIPMEAAPPDSDSLSFVSGAHLIASHTFLNRVGPMREDYFLYYEEVDWAMRREEMPLVLAPGALVYHHGGTVIGSGSATRRASGFANYFNYRNRMRFVRRFTPWALPTAYLYSLAKTIKLALLGAWPEWAGAFCGLHGMAPPRSVSERITPDAWQRAFGKVEAEFGNCWEKFGKSRI